MNLLSNICNHKDQHFEQQKKTQAYKPLSDYVFENRAMDRMRARYQRDKNYQSFKYQSWNHPYSISNYVMQKNSIQQGENYNYYQQQQQSGYVGNEKSSYVGSQTNIKGSQNTGNKKISFKGVSSQQFCPLSRGQQHGQRQFGNRDQFYSTMKQAYPYYNSHYLQHQSAPHLSIQTLNLTSQSYSHSLLGKQIVQLKQQNQQLKRVIQNQYKPLKELYNKLLVEQQEREYLISKLEWKVRELVKDLRGVNNSGESGGLQIRQQLVKSQVSKGVLEVPVSNIQCEKQHPYISQTPINTQAPLKSSLLNPTSNQPNLISINASSHMVFNEQLNPNITNLSMYFPQYRQQIQTNTISYQQNQNNIPSHQSYLLDNSYHSINIPNQNHSQMVNFQNNQFIVSNKHSQVNIYQNKLQGSNFQAKKNS